jgi:hypothetical protein
MIGIAIRSCSGMVGSAGSPLAAVARDAPRAASRLRRWQGRSGRSYVASCYELAALPDYDKAVVIGIAWSGRVVSVGEGPEPGEGLAAFVRRLAQAGVVEAHVHLLAETEAERRAAISDLSAALL